MDHGLPERALHDLAGLRQGDHVCAVYDEPTDQIAAIVAYMKEGLETGERCVYIVDDRTGEEVTAALEVAGVDVGAARDAARLQLSTSRDTYLENGVFDPVRMVQTLGEMTEEALAAGCQGLRITGEMTWALGRETGCDRLIEYEVRLNEFFPGSRAHAICQYNRTRFDAAIVRDVLRTHPKAVIGPFVCPNLYYEPPELIRTPEGDARRVAYMIDQLSAARTAQLRLEEANSRLQAAVQARDEFLSVASHELKTPLNALKLACTLMTSLAGGKPDAMASAVPRVERQVHRLATLVEQLLDVSRITEDRVTLAYSDGDLYQIVRETVGRFDLDATESGCLLAVEGDATPGRWDKLRVEQIVANLLSNAFKFGAGEPITVKVTAENGKAQLSVRDRGIGIPRNEQSRLFKRFERLSSSQRFGGLGLGLWIVRNLAERMGGEAHVTSEAGAGATFAVTLPRYPEDEHVPFGS